jgi:branched-chain amino acid transport system ATP-binding protein
MAHRGYVLETGRISLSGTSEALLNDDRVKRAYLGI